MRNPIAQGISLASFHSNKRSVPPSLFLRPLDKLKRAIAAKNATVESFTNPFTPKNEDQCS